MITKAWKPLKKRVNTSNFRNISVCFLFEMSLPEQNKPMDLVGKYAMLSLSTFSNKGQIKVCVAKHMSTQILLPVTWLPLWGWNRDLEWEICLNLCVLCASLPPDFQSYVSLRHLLTSVSLPLPIPASCCFLLRFPLKQVVQKDTRPARRDFSGSFVASEHSKQYHWGKIWLFPTGHDVNFCILFTCYISHSFCTKTHIM